MTRQKSKPKSSRAKNGKDSAASPVLKPIRIVCSAEIFSQYGDSVKAIPQMTEIKLPCKRIDAVSDMVEACLAAFDELVFRCGIEFIPDERKIETTHKHYCHNCNRIYDHIYPGCTDKAMRMCNACEQNIPF